MTFQTSDTLRRALLEQPESGMGYQIAIIGQQPYVVFNADVAVPVLHIPFRFALASTEDGATSQSAPRQPVPDNGTSTFRFFGSPYDIDPRHTEKHPPPHSFALSEQHADDLAKIAEKTLAGEDLASTIEEFPVLDHAPFHIRTHNSYPSQTRAGELFARYCAFANDRRIMSDRSIRPGTYATSFADSNLVPSGLCAVARYALPDPTPAIHRFVLSPPARTPIHCGTVTPQFGQAGGGVEVRFDNQLQPGSAHGPQPIPER